MEIKKNLIKIIILLVLVSPGTALAQSAPDPGAHDGNISGANISVSEGVQAPTVPGLFPTVPGLNRTDQAAEGEDQEGRENTRSPQEQQNPGYNLAADYSTSDAASDAVAAGGEKLLVRMADDIYGRFGIANGFIFQFITFNLDPRELPIIEEFYKDNRLLAVPCVMLFLMGECILRGAAQSNPSAYANVFGRKDWSHSSYAGGGLLMIAGVGAAIVYFAFMALLDIYNAYVMLSVMESIRPSADNAVMYFSLAVIELALGVFFFYRQILIVAMYPFSPFVGVMFASGYCKEFIDSILDGFARAALMQPICVTVTVFAIHVMKAFEVQFYGTTVWEADDEMVFYAILGIILLFVCWWCVKGDWSLIKRAIGFRAMRRYLIRV